MDFFPPLLTLHSLDHGSSLFYFGIWPETGTAHVGQVSTGAYLAPRTVSRLAPRSTSRPGPRLTSRPGPRLTPALAAGL